MYFCICTDSVKNIIGEIKTEKDKELTAQDIVKRLNLSFKTIWVKTEHYAYPLKDTDRPFIDRPELISKTRPGFWSYPPTTLFAFSNIEPNTNILFLTPKHNTELNIPRLSISISQTDLKSNVAHLYNLIKETFPTREKLNKTFKDASPQLRSTFLASNGNLPPTDIEFESLTINDQKIGDNTTINEIFEKLKAGNEISVSFKISKILETYLDYRKRTVDDFVSSEERFVKDLVTLNEDWRHQLKNKAFFSDYDFTLLFQDIPTILAFHSQLLSLLKSKNEGYASTLSRIFLEQAPFFKISSNFISNYPTILQILQDANRNDEYKNFCKQYSEKHGGLYFESFLITPVQRITRYNLLLRDLRSRTLKNHPDSIFIDAACLSMQNISEEVDKKTGFIKSQKILMDIQMRNSSDFEFVKSDRRVIKQFDTFIKSRNLPGTFVACNDCIILIDNLDLFCRFCCLSSAVPIDVLDDNLSIRIDSPDYDDTYDDGNVISFSSDKDRDEFLSLIKIQKEDTK